VDALELAEHHPAELFDVGLLWHTRNYSMRGAGWIA
jgi:hypothetical protein